MITGQRVTIGDLGIVRDGILQGGEQRKASPAPVQRLPSSSSIPSIAAAVIDRDYVKSSWAFVAKTFHSHLSDNATVNSNMYGLRQVIKNWNASGQLNA